MVIDPATTHAEGKVVFGATVEYEDCDTEKKSTYQIVGEDEADFKIGKISIGSPLARALIGKEWEVNAVAVSAISPPRFRPMA